jgi:N-acyl homoserine lactone hydrolase
VRLYILHGGDCCVDKGRIFTPGIDEGKLVRIPIPLFLVETDDGERVLVDTGMHPVHIDDPEHTFGDMSPHNEWILPMMRREDTLEHRLGEIGLAIDDITHVVNTHLHFDHCGQNYLFTNVPIILQREHYEIAMQDEHYPHEYFDLPELRYELIEGDQQLFGGIHGITAPGHAPGLMALLFELPNSGSALLCTDAIDSQEHLDKDIWEHCRDPELAKESAEKLQRIAAEENATMLFGHDLAQWKSLRHAPQYYD